MRNKTAATRFGGALMDRCLADYALNDAWQQG